MSDISSASLTSSKEHQQQQHQPIQHQQQPRSTPYEDRLRRSYSLKRSCQNRRHSNCGKMHQPREETKKLTILKPGSWNKILSKFVHKMTAFNVYGGGGGVTESAVGNNFYNNCGGSVGVGGETAYVAAGVERCGIPGTAGLRNHGNTCFMNAVLQCLFHTDILAEYFVLDHYKADASRRNKMNCKKYGTKGEITEQLAALLKSVWSCQYTPELSYQFKMVVEKYGMQYRGSNQHDAQEFFLWLLDKVHEDLNTATKKKYKAIKNSFGRPDIVAAESLANHVRCNNSFVHALFQAQFCSSVTCPRCDRQSNTFDPFLCVSIPVPQNQVGIYCTVLYSSQQPRQVKLGMMLPAHDEVKDLRKLLASYTGVDERSMLITEITDRGFERAFPDNTLVGCFKEMEGVYCLELPEVPQGNDLQTGYMTLCWVNVLVESKKKCTRFGSPFTMPISRETSYVDLQKLLLKEMAWMLFDDVLTSEQDVPLFRIRLADVAAAAEPDACYLDWRVELPLFTECVEHALAINHAVSGYGGYGSGGGGDYLKLVLEWDWRDKKMVIADDTDTVQEHSSVKQLKITKEQGVAVTLEECFKQYTQAEILAAENAWHCPNCNLKQDVVKQLGLWTLPDILVVHLKRFKQVSSKHQNNNRTPAVKLTSYVDFPLFALDMTPHLAPGYRGASQPNLWSPWKRPSSCKQSSLKREGNVYDLYAICNHHGQDLASGHYTAYCRNPFDGLWYSFDDSRVSEMAETSLVTSAAYMLFYARRGLASYTVSGGGANNLDNATGGGGGCGGTAAEHWASKLLTASVAKMSKSSEEIANDNNFFKNCNKCKTDQASTPPLTTAIVTGKRFAGDDLNCVQQQQHPRHNCSAYGTPRETVRKAILSPRSAKKQNSSISTENATNSVSSDLNQVGKSAASLNNVSD